MRRLAAPLAVAVGAAAAGAFIHAADPTTPGGVIPECPSKHFLGVICPGCGSMRMIYSLLHLDFGAALRFNAVGLLVLVALIGAFARWTWRRARGDGAGTMRLGGRAAWCIAAVVVAWLVVRNIPVAPFTALRV
ncbi:DUF2752 domain-containing protein [Tomitella fengzijianii]|uniref:DUF2752 domain-containing protein n=1 Tax=Tomitella fengzijianii TaxID=2597660 RepID=UPI001E2D6F18|nr:DUF2752 domain-containing protein [Tomitella fengzijianii]